MDTVKPADPCNGLGLLQRDKENIGVEVDEKDDEKLSRYARIRNIGMFVRRSPNISGYQ